MHERRYDLKYIVGNLMHFHKSHVWHICPENPSNVSYDYFLIYVLIFWNMIELH